MNNNIKKYKKIEDSKVTTSEVLQSSFKVVFDKLEKEDYVIVENKRRKETLVVQRLDKYVQKDMDQIIPVRQKFEGKARTVSDNVLLAKQYLKENVYYLMKFESENITFPDVEYYLNNPEALKQKNFNVEITINLVNAWRYMLNLKHFDSIEDMLDIHAIVAKDQAMDFGYLRDGKVSVSNTKYIPPIPTKESMNKLFEEFNTSTNIYKGASTLLVKLIKAQPFWDGNKRTAFLTVNRLLIDSAKGIIIVNDKLFKEFSNHLSNYYNDEKTLNTMVEFLMTKCIYNTKDKKLIKN